MISSVSAQVNTTVKNPNATSVNKEDNKTSISPNSTSKKKYDAKKPIENKEQVNNPNAPIITFSEVEYDYGTMEQLADGNCEFTFTNDGQEPLILSNVRSSCGCTTPKWPRQPILPGDSEVIKVKYDTKKVGTFKKYIYVTSNATSERVTLTIKGKVEAKPGVVIPEKHTTAKGSKSAAKK